jgi:hypothetical protein
VGSIAQSASADPDQRPVAPAGYQFEKVLEYLGVMSTRLWVGNVTGDYSRVLRMSRELSAASGAANSASVVLCLVMAVCSRSLLYHLEKSHEAVRRPGHTWPRQCVWRLAKALIRGCVQLTLEDVAQFRPDLIEALESRAGREGDPMLAAPKLLVNLNLSGKREVPADAPMPFRKDWRGLMMDSDRPARRTLRDGSAGNPARQAALG